MAAVWAVEGGWDRKRGTVEGANASGVYGQVAVSVFSLEGRRLFVRVSRAQGPSHSEPLQAHRRGASEVEERPRC